MSTLGFVCFILQEIHGITETLAEQLYHKGNDATVDFLFCLQRHSALGP